MRHALEMCRSRLCDLYWVSTTILRYRALTRLLSAKSTSRYTPPWGTAGFARSAVRGMSRLPSPPARTTAMTFFGAAMAGPYGVPGRSHYGERRAHRPVDTGVPAGRLRRGRRSCREPRRGAAPPRRRAGAGVRLAAVRSGGDRGSRPAGARLGERRPADVRRRPDHGGRLRRRRRRPLPYLVRQPGRPPGGAAERRARRALRAQPRAAAPMEGRAARRRLRPVVVGGGDRLPGGVPGDRGERGDAGGHPAVVPVGGPSEGGRRPQRDRPVGLAPARGPGRRPRSGDRSRPALGGVRRADHATEGAAVPVARRGAPARGGPAGAVRGGTGHAGDHGRGAGAGLPPERAA